ncbi:RhoGAP domain protein [Dictyocaulus viviparus]|uniref:RhoGAP domain protein n=1 Tax=Dictyocaulus viviparus TaxID=29172 RepID=A0A0D8XUR1_DICVI|nr:RhoGAP domain protein [Dictyocaulus viviparus]
MNHLEDVATYSSEDSRKVMQLYAALHANKGGCISISLNGFFIVIAEMVKLLDQMSRIQRTWKAAEEKILYYKELQMKGAAELESVTSELRRTKAELKDARAQIVSQLDESNALRADNAELLQRFQIVKEVLKLDIEQLPPESRKQLAFLRNPDLGRSNSKRVAREQYMEEGEMEEAMDYDVSENTLDTLDDDDEHERRARNHSVGLRGRRSISAHVHPVSASKRRSSRPCDPTSAGALINENEETQVDYFMFRRARNHSVGLRGRRSISAHVHPVSASKRRSSRPCDPTSAGALINENEETRDSPLPAKRSRETTGEIVATTAMTVDSNMKSSQPRVTIRRSMNRSMSANDLLGSQTKTPASAPRTPFVPRTTSTLELRTTNRTPGGGSWTRGMPITNRPHHFQPLSKYLKMTSCDVCHGGINFAAKPAYKCRDCLQLTHVSCSSRLVLPCVPRTNIFPRTPNRRGQQVYHLQEFCPALPPMIAYPIIYCVSDLENRGLSREGLYRVPGRKDHVQSVLNELRTSRGIPKLNIQEMEVVVDVIKSFLRELRDPLVPKSSREEFIRAAQTNNVLSLNVAICDLPQPNRDTLSYLMLHLQKVEALKEVNRMSFENIARCMAIPIMGQTSYPRGDIHVASNDAREKERSVLQMLKMSSEYWLQFLETEESRKENAGYTPAGHVNYETSCANKSMLGPVTISPAAPNLLRPIARRPQKFFDSPM